MALCYTDEGPEDCVGNNYLANDFLRETDGTSSLSYTVTIRKILTSFVMPTVWLLMRTSLTIWSTNLRPTRSTHMNLGESKCISFGACPVGYTDLM